MKSSQVVVSTCVPVPVNISLCFDSRDTLAEHHISKQVQLDSGDDKMYGVNYHISNRFDPHTYM